MQTWNWLSELQITFLQYVADRVAVVDDWVRGVVSLDDQIVGPVPISKESPLLSANWRKWKWTLDRLRAKRHYMDWSWRWARHGLSLGWQSERFPWCYRTLSWEDTRIDVLWKSYKRILHFTDKLVEHANFVSLVCVSGANTLASNCQRKLKSM